MKKVGGLVYLTAEEMAEADRASIKDFGIDVLSLMENAGLGTARLAQKLLGGSVKGRTIWCLVGKGNNGGDGLVAARHLHNWGARVSVVLGGSADEVRDVPLKQLETVRRMGIPIQGPEGGFGDAEFLVDALLGYGSKGDPREPLAGIIRKANASGLPILAVDLPSGLDATSGEPGNPCVVAKATVTFGLPKAGFLNRRAKGVLGELYLADISMPEGVYSRFSQDRRIFVRSTLVSIWKV